MIENFPHGKDCEHRFPRLAPKTFALARPFSCSKSSVSEVDLSGRDRYDLDRSHCERVALPCIWCHTSLALLCNMRLSIQYGNTLQSGYVRLLDVRWPTFISFANLWCTKYTLQLACLRFNFIFVGMEGSFVVTGVREGWWSSDI